MLWFFCKPHHKFLNTYPNFTRISKLLLRLILFSLSLCTLKLLQHTFLYFLSWIFALFVLLLDCNHKEMIVMSMGITSVTRCYHHLWFSSLFVVSFSSLCFIIVLSQGGDFMFKKFLTVAVSTVVVICSFLEVRREPF